MMRRLAKSILHGLANAVCSPARRMSGRGDEIFILTWHAFSEFWRPDLVHALPISLFELQIDWLIKHFNIVPLGDACSAFNCDGSSSRRPLLAITIDDGYADNYTLAYPVLRARNLPATVFVATDFLDSGRAPWPVRLRYILERSKSRAIDLPISLPLANARDREKAAVKLKRHITPLVPNEREVMLARLARQCGVADWETAIRPMTWGQLREMSAHDITIGAHTHHHSILPAMPIDVATADIARSRERIEAELGEPCGQFAYPDGKYDESVRQAVEASGFLCGVTQDRGTNSIATDRLTLRRIHVPHHDPFPTFIRRLAFP